MWVIVVAALAFSGAAAAHGERSFSSSGSDPSVLRLAVLCGLTLATAAAVHALISRRTAKASTRRPQQKEEVPSVLQRDEELERVAEASAQVFAVGARVKLADSHGDGVVLGYDPANDSYKLQLLENDNETVTVRGSELARPRITQLVVFPIKSCGSLSLDSVQVTEKGLLHDREWMFVDEKGKFLTQRRYHKLALVHPKLVPSFENPTAIILTAKGMPDLEVPIIRESRGKEMPVVVWKSNIIAIDQGDAAAEWITTFMADKLGNRKLRFVHFKETFTRPVHEKYAPGSQTGFADAFPILLTVEASIDDLNQHLKEPIPMNRFRPNVVLDGTPAYADDHWNCLTIGSLKFRNVRPCSRCNLPCVDQITAESHPGREPARTLVRVRNGVALGFEGAVKGANYFGSNIVPEKLGRLSVGDPVRILTMKNKIVA